MKLTKIHRVSKFKQSDWLKKYIDFNADKRKNAAISFEKYFFKLMNNSVFGKTMENLRIRISVKLVNNAKDYVNSISKPRFVSQKIFSKHFVAIHKLKPVLTLNKPIYVGFSILDLLMYDTDSLVYEIKTKDVYEDFYDGTNSFDFSDYSLKSKFFDPVNKKVIGKMKDEFKGKIISELVGLKSKMYSLISVDAEGATKAKRVNKKIKHNKFVDVLFNKKVISHNMKRIQSKLHRIGTYDICKISFSCFDDKRYILDDNINSLAYFHEDIKD